MTLGQLEIRTPDRLVDGVRIRGVAVATLSEKDRLVLAKAAAEIHVPSDDYSSLYKIKIERKERLRDIFAGEHPAEKGERA